MAIAAIVAVLIGIIGVGLVVKEVHEVVEEPAFPILGIALAIVSFVVLLRSMKA